MKATLQMCRGRQEGRRSEDRGTGKKEVCVGELIERGNAKHMQKEREKGDSVCATVCFTLRA